MVDSHETRSPKGCKTIAGGRSIAKTTGKRGNKSSTMKGCEILAGMSGTLSVARQNHSVPVVFAALRPSEIFHLNVRPHLIRSLPLAVLTQSINDKAASSRGTPKDPATMRDLFRVLLLTRHFRWSSRCCDHWLLSCNPSGCVSAEPTYELAPRERERERVQHRLNGVLGS